MPKNSDTKDKKTKDKHTDKDKPKVKDKDKDKTKDKKSKSVKIADTAFTSGVTAVKKDDKHKSKHDKTGKTEKTGKSGAHRTKPVVDEKDIVYIYQGKKILCNGEPPTAEELKLVSLNEPKPAKPFVYMVLMYGSEIRCYSKVPRELMEPFRLFLDGTIDLIHTKRIEQFKLANPKMREKDAVKKVLWPGGLMDIDTILTTLSKYYLGNPRGFLITSSTDETTGKQDQELFFGELLY
ncbi:MAG: hypothetical protein Solumvirus2_42 [Solumvirus sp.]|uniref:Uncharacterized protein n=1 Tax=Solumvirus sp. TaxID=2487773 RepID=A0A3G5AG96_9VIRU|nr:MAG: hypothetical protein Solumvirus2_42 [Solumvirus sp.]